MTNKEKIEALPEHLKGITFEPWHFYYNKKAKAGENRLILSDNFIDEVMRQKNLHFLPEITNIVPLNGDNNKILMVANVMVFDEEDYNYEEHKPLGKVTIGYASMTEMPHAGGQTHYAQMCVTRALKNAVIRHLKISDHDVQLVVDAYGFDMKQITSQTRTITDEIEEESIEAPVEAMPDLGDLGV
jgi:hypothetical protein